MSEQCPICSNPGVNRLRDDGGGYGSRECRNCHHKWDVLRHDAGTTPTSSADPDCSDATEFVAEPDAEPFGTAEQLADYPVPRGFVRVAGGYVSNDPLNEIAFYGWLQNNDRLAICMTHSEHDFGYGVVEAVDAEPGCEIALAKLGAEIARAQGVVDSEAGLGAAAGIVLSLHDQSDTLRAMLGRVLDHIDTHHVVCHTCAAKDAEIAEMRERYAELTDAASLFAAVAVTPRMRADSPSVDRLCNAVESSTT